MRSKKAFLSPLLIIFCLSLTGCIGNFKKSDKGYYGGDSAPKENRNLDNIPDAIPTVEPLSRTGNKPYKVLGKQYYPLKSSKGFSQTGMASWYGKKFHGRRTSSGEPYNMWAMTAAHPVLPLPTYVRVKNLDSGKSVIVKVNDRGPFLHNRVIDLSYAAAHKLGIANAGTGRVTITAIDPKGFAATAGVGNSDANQPDSVDGQDIFVQVGAFSILQNARELRNYLEKLDQPVFPKSESKNFSDGAPYRVQLGPFSSIEKALDVKSNLEQLLGQTLILIIK